MAKTKRKHLAALDVQERQKDPAQEAPIRSLSPSNPELLALASPSSLSPKDQENSPNHRDPPAEVSWASLSFQAGGLEAVANMKRPCLRQDDDADSDCNSWVEVRKQRVVIIIPRLPEAKSKPPITKLTCLHKDNTQHPPRKNRAVLPQDRGSFKIPSSKVYGKKAWNAIMTLETDSKGNGSRMQKTISRDAPPISSMDILLASALGTDHTPWQEMQHHHIDLLASCTKEEASLDTADSSIQPKSTLAKRIKPVIRNKGALKLHCKPAHSNKAKKLMRSQKATCLNYDLRTPDYVNMNERQGLDSSSVLSVSQSIKVVTLKKHLENAGGLKGWLCSLGLGQFKEAFGKRRWSEGDLLQLRMDDLKQMGKTAVGPRRKLIWAIHHLSQQMI